MSPSASWSLEENTAVNGSPARVGLAVSPVSARPNLGARYAATRD
jgi:hypothetical protein